MRIHYGCVFWVALRLEKLGPIEQTFLPLLQTGLLVVCRHIMGRKQWRRCKKKEQKRGQMQPRVYSHPKFRLCFFAGRRNLEHLLMAGGRFADMEFVRGSIKVAGGSILVLVMVWARVWDCYCLT